MNHTYTSSSGTPVSTLLLTATGGSGGIAPTGNESKVGDTGGIGGAGQYLCQPNR
jgi:hypothetical protein